MRIETEYECEKGGEIAATRITWTANNVNDKKNSSQFVNKSLKHSWNKYFTLFEVYILFCWEDTWKWTECSGVCEAAAHVYEHYCNN